MSNRPETGPMRFGPEDWTGVYLRGDAAFMYRIMLEHLLAQPLKEHTAWSPILEAQARGLISLLDSCHEPAGSSVQVLKPYTDCKVRGTGTGKPPSLP